jgi:PPOX class probable F420-dependent enzyme
VNSEEARRRFAAARVARLATAGADGAPHLVPIVFAVARAGDRDLIYSVVDAKRKRTVALRRLVNVAANPAVSVLVDHYEEDWGALWWARADGVGRVLGERDTKADADADADAGAGADADAGAGAGSDAEESERAIALLARRYPQQRAVGAVLAIEVRRWSGWSAR